MSQLTAKKLRLRWLISAGSLLLLAITGAWWLSDREAVTAVTPYPVPVPVAETFVPTVKPPLPEAESGGGAVQTTTAGFARRISHVPNTHSPQDDSTLTTDLRDITAANIEQFLQANLEQALDGEMDSAYFVTRTRMACERFASSPEDLEKRIQRTNKKVEKDIERGRDLPARKDGGLPWSPTSNSEDNRAHMERWYEACQRVASMFTADLRQQLEALALKGDVMAGYLYATWPLEQLNVGEAFDQQYRWEGLARDFSQANLDRGEVAGLMAFAQSYMRGWFTDDNGDLALAFAIAAVNCSSFETISLHSFLNSRVEHLANSDDPADLERLQFALAEADRLGSHCTP